MKNEIDFPILLLVTTIKKLYEANLEEIELERTNSEEIDFYFGKISGYYEVLQVIRKLLIKFNYLEDLEIDIISKINF